MRRAAHFYIQNSNSGLQLADVNAALQEMLFSGGSLNAKLLAAAEVSSTIVILTIPMLTTVAISNYRSHRDLVVPLKKLNVVTGSNGSGKSNLYRALPLPADSAKGRVVSAIAGKAAFGRLSGLDQNPCQHQ